MSAETQSEAWKGTQPAEGTRRRLLLDVILGYEEGAITVEALPLADAIEEALLNVEPAESRTPESGPPIAGGEQPPPTVGRIVHFFTDGSEPDSDPRAAIITAVHNEVSDTPNALDLYVFPPEALSAYAVVRVPDQPEDGDGHYWVWPPRV